MTNVPNNSAGSHCRLCSGVGYFFDPDLPVGHPDFGKPIPCKCTQDKIAQREREAREAKKAARRARRSPKAPPPPPARHMTEFSYSKLVTFQQCPLRFKLAYLERERTTNPRARDFVLANLVHATLHAFMKMEPDERSLPTLQALFDDSWHKYWHDASSTQGDEERWWLASWESLSQSFLSGHCAGVPIDLEIKFSFNLDQYTIKGKLDRVDALTPGEHHVIDYKAFESPMTRRKATRDLQTVLYYFGAQVLYGMPPTRITYLYLQDGTIVSVEPDSEHMDRQLSKVSRLIETIRGRKQFNPHTNPFCGNCREFGKCNATKLKST